MKAWRLHEPGAWSKERIECNDVERPAPQEEELLIRVRACGICHTDLHLVKNEISPGKLPVTLGHQIVGTVEENSTGNDRFCEGDQVGVPWLHKTCGTCEDCRSGQENLCRNSLYTGCDRDGGYAPYMTAPASFAYRVSETLSPVDVAPLLCGGVIGYRALNLSEIEEGQRLGLYGFGSSASMVIQVANSMDCECYVFTRSEKHRELARSLDAVWAGSADDDPGEKMHGSILFAPAGPLVPSALDQLRQGGTLSIAGIYLSPIPEMDYDKHLYRERAVRSVTACTREDVKELLNLAAEIGIETQTELFSFEELPEALDRMERSEHNASPVLDISDMN